MTGAATRIIIQRHGGPELLELERFEPVAPSPGQILVQTEAVGLNYIDTYHRSGLYPVDLPAVLGSEAAGIVLEIGEGVTGFRVGDRVASATASGSYTTHWTVPAGQLVHVPDTISMRDAAAMLLKGMTACFLAEDIVALQPGQTALVHAAAGGVGSILVPWLRDKGVVVVAHSGSPEKAGRVNADHSLHGPLDSLPSAVRSLTDGKGVDIVYDGIGKDSWAASIASLKRRGMMVSYGNASGAVPPINLLDLNRAGSLYVTRPKLFDYVATRQELEETARRLFDRMERGVVSAVIGQDFPLRDVASAHRALESRRTVGATILTP